MVPLVINQNKKFDQFNFKNYLIQTCKQHREEGRALAFAFIIYDFENHTISEILEKRNYWNSLDKISGKKLSIFYVNSNDSYFEQTQEKIYQAELQQSRINSGSDTFSFLVPITRKPTQTDNAIEFAKNQFNIDENVKTPFVLFFQIDNEDNISDSFIIRLKQDRLEDAFLELRDHIKRAVESLSKVLPENYGNHLQIFNLIRTGVESGQFYDFIDKKIKPYISIERLISIIRLFAIGH